MEVTACRVNIQIQLTFIDKRRRFQSTEGNLLLSIMPFNYQNKPFILYANVI